VWVVVNSIKVFHVLITLEYRIIADDYSATQQIGVFFVCFFFLFESDDSKFLGKLFAYGSGGLLALA